MRGGQWALPEMQRINSSSGAIGIDPGPAVQARDLTPQVQQQVQLPDLPARQAALPLQEQQLLSQMRQVLQQELRPVRQQMEALAEVWLPCCCILRLRSHCPWQLPPQHKAALLRQLACSRAAWCLGCCMIGPRPYHVLVAV